MAAQILLFLACAPFLVAAQTPSAGEIQYLSSRNADFACRLYRAVARSTDANVLLAPLTASQSLAALSGGAEGTTRTQLVEALCLASLGPDRIPDLFESLWIGSLNQSVGLSQAISLVASQQFNIPAEFRGVAEKKYFANIQSLDFSSPQAAKEAINELALRLTANQVKDVVGSIAAQTQLMLVNAAFLQGPFTLGFNASLTQEERFYVDKYHIVQVPMMFRSDKYHLAYDRLLKLGVLKLPMQGGTAMLVLLPDEGTEITSVEEELTVERFQGWLRQLKRTKLEVQLPRFRLEQSYFLQKVLPGLGVTELFQDTADLSGVVGDKGIKLSEIVHKAGVVVDETGSGAGGTQNVFTSLPPRLTINRPFLFIIYHEITGCILLMGRVVDPTKV